jgi:predicted RNase H-like nuclease
MPIGLSPDGRREPDFEARRMIGPRRSSVFPTPPRALLTVEGDYWALNTLARSLRAGISQQTYNLLPKIREVDSVMTPELQARVRESHPEVSFCALNGDCLPDAKRTAAGQQARLHLLERVFTDPVTELRPPRGAALDDLYDALVLTWTAARIARNEARTLPSHPARDERGLRMEIVY